MYKYLKKLNLLGFLNEIYFLVVETGKDAEFWISNLSGKI